MSSFLGFLALAIKEQSQGEAQDQGDRACDQVPRAHAGEVQAGLDEDGIGGGEHEAHDGVVGGNGAMAQQPLDPPAHQQQAQDGANSEEAQGEHVAPGDGGPGQAPLHDLLQARDVADDVVIVAQYQHDHGAGDARHDHGARADEAQNDGHKGAAQAHGQLPFAARVAREVRESDHDPHHQHEHDRAYDGKLLPLHLLVEHGEAAQDHADEAQGGLEEIVLHEPLDDEGEAQDAHHDADDVGDQEHDGRAPDLLIPAGDGDSLLVDAHGHDHGPAADPGDQHGQAHENSF